jgi:hypothetical protein
MKDKRKKKKKRKKTKWDTGIKRATISSLLLDLLYLQSQKVEK